MDKSANFPLFLSWALFKLRVRLMYTCTEKRHEHSSGVTVISHDISAQEYAMKVHVYTEHVFFLNKLSDYHRENATGLHCFLFSIIEGILKTANKVSPEKLTVVVVEFCLLSPLQAYTL